MKDKADRALNAEQTLRGLIQPKPILGTQLAQPNPK